MLATSQKDLTISDLLTGDLQLASPPNIFYEFKKAVDDSNKSIADAAYIIEKDAALSLKLLKIVNSAFYGFPANISSIARASSIIGITELQNLILSTVIIEKFSAMPGETLSMNDFWARSLHCALIAKELDLFLGKKYSESIFLCGLFHDIGQLVFFRRIPVLAREVELELQARQQFNLQDEVNAEESLIGFNHFETGAELCRLWNLPEIIIESIRLHNHPDDNGDYCETAALARLANHYSKSNNNTDLINNSLGISEQDITAIIANAEAQFDEIFKLFFAY